VDGEQDKKRKMERNPDKKKYLSKNWFWIKEKEEIKVV